MRRLFLLTALLALLALFVAACGGSDNKSSTSAPAAAASPDAASTAARTKPSLTGSVTVFAAASLTDSFNEMATAFKAANPGVSNVTFNFAGSPVLRTQLEQGARADIYASADTIQMGNAATSGVVVDKGKIFVRNSLVIITPADATPKVTSLADLAKPGLKLVLANKDVPVGNYARQMLASMEKDPSYGAGYSDKVLKNLVSEESDVKQVVAKVQLGEADYGVVYGTDLTPSVASKLKTVTVPAQYNVVAEYPVAVVKGAGNAAAAQGFIDFVLSAPGQAIMKKYGFQTANS
jgi:molybdate transport system substrate-binding protein